MSKESTLRSNSLSAPHEQYLNEEMKRTPIRSELKQVDTMPEGGRQAWLTVAGSFIIQFCAFGYSTSFGIYQDFYTREYLSNESSSTISWIGSVNNFLVLGSGIIVGRLFDRGYFYWLLWGGSLLMSFSLFMLSLAHPHQYYQIFLSQGLGAGLGAGILYVPSIAIVSQYFRERRALAMTIVASGSSLGAFLHPIMLNNTINGSLGFANGTRANAGLISGLLLISCVITRTRLPPPNRIPSLSKAISRIGHDWAFIFASVGLLIFAIGYYFPLFYIQLDATTRGLNTTFAFYTLVIMNACSFVGRLAPGILSQRGVSVANMFTFSCGACAILIFGMIGVKSDASFVIFGIIYGFFAGMFVALLGPILALLTKDMTELGARMGVAYLFTGTIPIWTRSFTSTDIEATTAVGGLIGGPINGALLTGNLIWWKPAVFSGAVCSVSCVLFSGMLIILHRKKHHDAQQSNSNPDARYR